MASQIINTTAVAVDPNVGARSKLYAGLGLALPLISFLASFNIFTTEQGNALAGFLTAGAGLATAFGFGLAATKSNNQAKNAIDLDALPAPIVTPAVAAVDAIATVASQYNDLINTVTSGVQQVHDTVGNLAAVLPGLPGVFSGLAPGSLAYQAVQAAGDAQLAAQALGTPPVAPVSSPGS